MAGPTHRGGPLMRWTVNVDRIERARLLNAWTRKHLATVAQVDQKTLTDMCSGRRRPTLGTVQAVCAALNLTVAEAILFPDDMERMDSHVVYDTGGSKG